MVIKLQQKIHNYKFFSKCYEGKAHGIMKASEGPDLVWKVNDDFPKENNRELGGS